LGKGGDKCFFWGSIGGFFLLLRSCHFFFICSQLNIWLKTICFHKVFATQKGGGGGGDLKRNKNFFEINITINVGVF
jgi:hypothetical protein